MNSYKRTGLLAIFILLCFGATAQNFRYPVVARITQNAPYPIYLQDYANPSQTNFSIQLEVRDNSLPLRRVRLRLYISGPNGLIQSTPFVRNEKVIELAAGQFYDLPSPDVANYFQSNNLIISPAQYSEHLPDGTYQFGIEVIDDLTNKPLSGVQYAPPVWLVVNDPPVIIIPENETAIKVETPQFLNFQWMPRHRNATDVSYEFSLTELHVPLDYAGNIQNLFLAQPPFYTEITTQTQLNYDFSKPPLTPGKIYAYRIRAIAKNGLEEIGMFRNNGYSEIRWFRYVEPLLAPYNFKVQRENEDRLKLNWQGFDNHEAFVLNYRQRGALDWNTIDISKPESQILDNTFEDELSNCSPGIYEFRIGANALYFPETQYSEIEVLKDTSLAPYQVRSMWNDSTKAFVQWLGNQAHESFKVQYKTILEEDWRSLPYESQENYSLSDEFYEYGTFVNEIKWDTSYMFRVLALDFDGDELTSKESYLPKKKKIDEIVKLKEKRIIGNIKWAYLASEEQVGAVSGQAALSNTSSVFSMPALISENAQIGTKTHPLANAAISLFADSSCTILIKQMHANSLGEFNLNFPIEALRGGAIPEEVYLRFSDLVFGNHVLKVRTDFAADEYSLGEWLIPAYTLRLKTDVYSRFFRDSDPTKHHIAIYRRVQELSDSPYLKDEHFGLADTQPVKINNELFYKIGETNAGQVASGLFYTNTKKRQEFLLKYEGPSPFLSKYQKVILRPVFSKGIYEHQVLLNVHTGNPYIYGKISSVNGLVLNSGDLKLEVIRDEEVLNTSFPDASRDYKIHIPISKLDFESTYFLKVYYQNQLAETVPVILNRDELGTLIDIKLKANEQVGVVLRLRNLDNEALSNVTIQVGQKSYKTDNKGWVAFVAPNQTNTTIRLMRTGYPAIERQILIQATSKTNFVSSKILFGENISLKAAIAADLEKVGQNLNSSFREESYTRGRLLNALYNQLFSINDPTVHLVYAGIMGAELEDNTAPNPFELIIQTIDKNTKKPIPNVTLNENQLDLIGKTNDQGVITYKSNLGRGAKVFHLSPSSNAKDENGNTYGDIEFAYTFPALNSTLRKETIVIEMEAGALISGVVYKNGTNTTVPNALINIEYPGLDIQIKADANGKYSYRFNPTVQENFLTLTTTAEGYTKRTLYVATAKSYSTIYNRDIYLNPGGTEELEEETIEGYTIGMLVSLHGYMVRKITKVMSGSKEYSLTEMKKFVAIQPQSQAWTLSGQFIDKQGRVFNFEGATLTLRAEKIADKKYNIFLDEILSTQIPVSTARQNRKFFDAIQIADSEPLFLGAQYLYSAATVNKSKGVIYANKLTLDESESEDLRTIMDASKADGGFYQLNYSRDLINYGSTSNQDERLGKREFVISSSFSDKPIEKFEVFSGADHGNEQFADILSYYDKNTASTNLARQYKSLGARAGTGMFYFNNVLFKSFSITEKGPQINKVIVMPVKIKNIQIDLLNIDFVRLSENKIKDVLIDYSYSPRKLSMGEEIVRAQIEEVYVEEDGVDIVYFTNVGENVIDLKSPNMTPVNYNANGIFYSNYKTQKEIVQTASILNEVEMYQIPEPAMGPGMRIKVSSLMELVDKSSGYNFQQTLENSPKYAFNGTIAKPFFEEIDPRSPNLKLEGTADITMDPHVLKTFWKYDDKTKQWGAKLRSFTATHPTWGDVFRPTGIEIQVKDSSDVSLKYEVYRNDDNEITDTLSTVNFDELKGAELKVNYGVSVPALSTFEVVCEAKYNPEKKRFVRSTITGKSEITIPEVFEAKIGAAILLDTSEVVSGVFISGEINLILAGLGGSFSGGYACIANEKNPGTCDKIVGFVAGGSLEDGKGLMKKTTPASGGRAQSPFVLYGFKLGYLYDQASDGSYLYASTSMGFGHQERFDAELFQVMPDTKEDSTAKKNRRDAALQKLEDLENSAEGDLNKRETNLSEKNDLKNRLKNDLNAAEGNKEALKDDMSTKKADKKAKEKEFETKEKEDKELQERLQKLKDEDYINKQVAKNQERNDKKSDLDQKEGDLTTKTTAKNEAQRNFNEAQDAANKSKEDRDKAQREYDEIFYGTSYFTSTLAEREAAKAKLDEAKSEYEDKKRIFQQKEINKNKAVEEFDKAEKLKNKAKEDLEKIDEELTEITNGINELNSAKRDSLNSKTSLTAALTRKNEADSLHNQSVAAYESNKELIRKTSDSLTTAKADVRKAQKSLDEFNQAVSDTTKAIASYNKAVERKENIDSTDSALKKRYSSTDSTKYKGVKAFALESLFVIATGRSPFEPKEHKFTITDAEITISSSKSGSTITGAGSFGIQGQSLFDAGFLLHFGAGVGKVDTSGFRVFLAMPSLTIPKLGPITDITINGQLEFGNGFSNKPDGTKQELADFLIMASMEGTIQVTPFIYVNANARLAVAVNANTDKSTLDNRLAAGANLSETARKIVKFFGSSFNTIAENAINQRMAFFGALPEQYLVDGRFSGFYVGAKASALLGRTFDYDVPNLFAGSLRLGAGLEIGMGILKSIGTDSWEFRLGVNPILELTVRMRAPIEAILIDERIDYLSKFCLATGYNAKTQKEYIKLLYTVIKVDRIIGESVTPGAEVACNSFGFLYVKPCVGIFVRYNSEKPTENGAFVDTKLEEDPQQEICPIEW